MTENESELFELLRKATCENSDSEMYEHSVVAACEKVARRYAVTHTEQALREFAERVKASEVLDLTWVELSYIDAIRDSLLTEIRK